MKAYIVYYEFCSHEFDVDRVYLDEKKADNYCTEMNMGLDELPYFYEEYKIYD